MANYVYIATSLDGFIATINEKLDWLEELPNPEQSDYGFAEFMNNIDAVVMGRKTFDKVLTFERWVYDKPVFVLSNSLTKLSEEIFGKAEIISGDIERLIIQLNQKGYQNLYIDGGRVIQSFLQEDLIDEMIITRAPILLGKGFPLFSKLEKNLQFRHKKTEIYNNNLVKSHYIRDR